MVYRQMGVKAARGLIKVFSNEQVEIGVDRFDVFLCESALQT
jgi:hypothetical protein